jgi:hypothetical protein
MRERIENAFGVLNKLGTVMHISLNAEYKEARYSVPRKLDR